MSFQGFLKQSTAIDVLIGPFVDSTDGDAEETALTINQADVRLSKNGQAGAEKNDVTACAHDADGMYNCEFDATDTGTVGQLTLWVHVAGALLVRHDWHVIEEDIYDALYGASAAGFDTNQRVDVGSWLGGAIPAQSETGVPEVDLTFVSGVAEDVATETNVSTRATPSQVNDEVLDVFTVDTVAEEAQGVPPAAPTQKQILSYLYMTWRNASKATATERRIVNDAGVVIAKATMSDDGTTFDQGELVSGP